MERHCELTIGSHECFLLSNTTSIVTVSRFVKGADEKSVLICPYSSLLWPSSALPPAPLAGVGGSAALEVHLALVRVRESSMRVGRDVPLQEKNRVLAENRQNQQGHLLSQDASLPIAV